MFERLQGKTALITGASAGIGEATAVLFAKHGANLILTARRENLLQKLSETIQADYPTIQIHTIKLDVGNSESVKKAFENLPEWARNIDILVNNAGLSVETVPLKDIQETAIDTMLNTNIKGVIFLTQQVLPGMIERNSGHIINIGSVVGQMASPGSSVYSATKFALHAITDALRIETNSTKIRVSEVCPGLAETEFAYVKFDNDLQKVKSVYKGMEPLIAMDIAEVIAFTASTHPRCVISNITAVPVNQANSLIVHRD
ncbi:putative oxidoreductase [Smittium mucronatum]|uniref:Putative oxidoreductase n=1 Tax=Smittium mucronatum TaxID=133383 RepID=A0A1R0H422_9FUNG|nr:putative oxidoreductase [Smittium mucronatum]